mgnify:CR=1 FL=1
MRRLILPIIFATVLAGCSDDIFNYDPPSGCFPAHSQYVIEGDKDVIATFNEGGGKVYVPNCFTPNNEGVRKNNYFKPVFTYLNGLAWRGMEIYDSRKKLVATTIDSDTWNGVLDNGEVENGTYIFKAKLRDVDAKKDMYVIGSVCVRECFEEGDDYLDAVFPDMLVPSEGFILPTQESITFCD